MPQRAKKPCRTPMCPNLTDDGYCDQHKSQSSVKQYDKARGSSYERGYGRKWAAWRASILRRAEFALCRDHQAHGQYVVATELHHPLKVALHPELMYDEDNIMPLCKSCHSIRTSQGE